jgi:spermidine/putrescine transport system substrate-binding protein
MVFIKKLLIPMALAAFSVSTFAAGKLSVYNWGNYIAPEILTNFSKEFGVDVTLDTYDGNEEMVAKLQAGATGYDLVFPSVHFQDIMIKQGLLEKVKLKALKGYENLDQHFFRKEAGDPTQEYCIPYAWGTSGIVYNRKAFPQGLKTWKEFFAAKGQISMLDDMREVVAVAHISNGKDVNTTDSSDLTKARDFIIAARKKNLVGFTIAGTTAAVLKGDIVAAHYWTGALKAVVKNPDAMAYIIPDDGAMMYQENMCLLKSGPNKDNAKLFMEYFLRPEVAAMNANHEKNGTANTAALKFIEPALRNNPAVNPPKEVLARLKVFKDIGNDVKKYDRIWTAIKSAQ